MSVGLHSSSSSGDIQIILQAVRCSTSTAKTLYQYLLFLAGLIFHF